MDDLRERVKKAVKAFSVIDDIHHTYGLRRNWIVNPIKFPAEQFCNACGNKIYPGEEFYDVRKREDVNFRCDMCYKCAAPLVGAAPFNPAPKTWFNNAKVSV